MLSFSDMKRRLLQIDTKTVAVVYSSRWRKVNVVSGVSSPIALHRIGKLGWKPSGKQLQMQEEANGANTFTRVRAR